MKGTMYAFLPGNDQPEITVIHGPFTADLVYRYIERGYLEVVPGFEWFGEPGAFENVRCVAFCHEEGKQRHLPYNEEATVRWCDGLGADITRFDHLVGPVVVLVGDNEFMRTL